MLKAGIVGLPNVGKSTLFNALVANAQAQAANFPFCTIEPNVGTVSVPDERLQQLAELAGRSLTWRQLFVWQLDLAPRAGFGLRLAPALVRVLARLPGVRLNAVECASFAEEVLGESWRRALRLRAFIGAFRGERNVRLWYGFYEHLVQLV